MRIFLTSLFFLFFVSFLQSQTTFEKLYSDSITTSFYFSGGSGNIAHLPDSGYIYVNSAFKAGNSCILMGRLDKTGNVLWSKSIDDTKHIFYPKVTVSPTNLIYISCSSVDPLTSNFCSTILKFDLAGNLVWSKTYGSSTTTHQVVNVIPHSNSLFLAGNSYSIGAGNGDLFMQRTDTNGNIIWGITYNSNGDESLISSKKLLNNDMLICSNTVDSNGEYLTFYRIDINGNVVWNTRLRGANYEQIIGQGLNEDVEGNILATGFIDSIPGVGLGLWDIFVLKLSQAGVFKWGKLYGGNEYDEGWGIFPNKDKGYTVIAEPESYGSISRIALFKIDSLGNTSWAKLYGNPSTGGFPNHTLQNKDGGYTIYATNGDYSALAPMYLIKSDSLGNTTCPHVSVNLLSNNFNLIMDSPKTLGTLTGTLSYTPPIFSKSLTVNDYCPPLSIERINENIYDVSIYPNPNNGSFILQSNSENKNNFLVMYNLIGQKIHEEKIDKGTNVIHTVNLPKGLYYYAILQNKTQIQTGKIVIE
ncbi:MAG: T9SS type A sorting domain-containing protein [Bacteroidia bacterium]|nr:T9SS type A sorting domain-containing protein [Bacteroidia bacterium]